MQDKSMISLAGVTKVFYTDDLETHALDGIHLDVAKGEFLSISGPSGCGKSTLLAILGLLDTPTEGGGLRAEGSPRPSHDPYSVTAISVCSSTTRPSKT